MSQEDNICTLSYRLDSNGAIYVVDDLGRRLKGTRLINVNAPWDDVVTLSIETLCFDKDKTVLVNRGKPS